MMQWWNDEHIDEELHKLEGERNPCRQGVQFPDRSYLCDRPGRYPIRSRLRAN